MSRSDTLALPIHGLSLRGERVRTPDNGPLARVRTLEHEIEAIALHDVLEHAGIPHLVESYRDTAYDGLFQAARGWGALVVREEDAERAGDLIERALEDLLREEPEAGGDGDC